MHACAWINSNSKRPKWQAFTKSWGEHGYAWACYAGYTDHSSLSWRPCFLYHLYILHSLVQRILLSYIAQCYSWVKRVLSPLLDSKPLHAHIASFLGLPREKEGQVHSVLTCDEYSQYSSISFNVYSWILPTLRWGSSRSYSPSALVLLMLNIKLKTASVYISNTVWEPFSPAAGTKWKLCGISTWIHW
jgi:hypothetical protein